MSKPETRPVAVGIVMRRGKLLITRRRAGDHLASLWEFPGGKIEPGESIRQALARELAEETGLVLTRAEPFHETGFTYPERVVRLHFFLCEADGEPRNLETSGFAWVSPAELDSYPFPQANRDCLQKLRFRFAGG